MGTDERFDPPADPTDGVADLESVTPDAVVSNGGDATAVMDGPGEPHETPAPSGRNGHATNGGSAPTGASTPQHTVDAAAILNGSGDGGAVHDPAQDAPVDGRDGEGDASAAPQNTAAAPADPASAGATGAVTRAEASRRQIVEFFGAAPHASPWRVADGAWAGHIPFAFWLMDALRPSTFVELGVHKGNSYTAFCQAVLDLHLETSCYGVDTWKGDEHAGHYGDAIYDEFKLFHDAKFSAFSRLLRATFDDSLEYFTDGSIDLLHIDGLHTYDAVRHDFETWRPKLSSRAIVLFHDINVRERNFGVRRLWDELTGSLERPSFAFDHSNGLGVLAYGDQLAPQIDAFFALTQTPDGRAETKRFFTNLGQSLMTAWHYEDVLQQNRKLAAALEDFTQRVRSHDETSAALEQANAECARLAQESAERLAQIEAAAQRHDEALQHNAQLTAAMADLSARAEAHDAVAAALADMRAEFHRLEQRDTEQRNRIDAVLIAFDSLQHSSDLERERIDTLESEARALRGDDAGDFGLRGALASPDAVLAAKEEVLAAKERQIVAQNRRIRDKEVELARVSREFAETRAEVTRLAAAFGDGALAAPTAEPGGRQTDSEGDELRLSPRDVTRVRDTLLQFTDLVREMTRRINDLDQELAATHTAYTTSASWRLTAPVRFFSYTSRRIVVNARRIHGGLRALPEARARWGGFRGLARRIVMRLREEGVRGVLARADAFRADLDAPSAPVAAPIANNAPAVEDRPLRVVYVINAHDKMTFAYRVENYAKVLEAEGYVVTQVMDFDVAGVDLASTDVVVFCRTPWSLKVDRFLNDCAAAGIPTIYDIDDLIFDPDAIDFLPHVRDAASNDIGQIRRLLESQRKTMARCDHMTVSTAALLAEAEKRGKSGFVIRNNNGLAQQELCAGLREERRKRLASNDPTVRIGYFSGTNTHNFDFLQCADAVAEALDEHPNAVFLAAGEIELPASLDRHKARIERLPLTPHAEMLRNLSTVDINLAPLELDNAFTGCKSELKIFEAALLGIPTVASATKTFAATINHGRTGYLARTADDWRAALRALLASPDTREAVGEAARATIAPAFDVRNTSESLKSVLAATAAGRLRTPLAPRFEPPADAGVVISIVAVLYRKHNEVRFFLESLRRQNFAGDFEVILVNDASPADDVDVVREAERFANASCVGGGAMRVRILENDSNLGNCGSRNRGIAEAQGEIVIVVDADCMFNRDFLAAHYTSHAYADTDVCIGPLNIEAHATPPLVALERHEADPAIAAREMIPQDPVNLESFVNCITRNFSIKRRFIEDVLDEPLFDEAFAYSASPESGFGWEDVEMGYRLYANGATIKYVDTAISIHCTHPSSANEADKPLRSLKNYRRLFEKHPELLTTSRQWSLQTYEAIVGWASHVGADLAANADHHYLEGRMQRYREAPIIIDRSRPLRILTHRWHCPHQYELMKLGHDFTMVTGTGTALTEQWELHKRPMPRNARFVHADEVDPREYDVALVQFDENALRPDLCNGRVPLDWGETLKWFMANVDLPKVAICHGTPQFYGQYDADYDGADALQVMEDSRRELVELMRPVSALVCNSHQAMEEWGFANSRVIWHGFSPSEYPPNAVRDGGCLAMTMGAMQNRPYYNGLFTFEDVGKHLGGRALIWTLNMPYPEAPYAEHSQEWARALYQNYAREISRYSVYFNPTLRSPMPRSRGEAMMAGLVSVSLRNHDVDLFIKNGVNGFYADAPAELAEQLAYLEHNPAQRDAMGRESRRLAMQVFNQDRYLSAWSQLLNDVLS